LFVLSSLTSNKVDMALHVSVITPTDFRTNVCD